MDEPIDNNDDAEWGKFKSFEEYEFIKSSLIKNLEKEINPQTQELLIRNSLKENLPITPIKQWTWDKHSEDHFENLLLDLAVHKHHTLFFKTLTLIFNHFSSDTWHFLNTESLVPSKEVRYKTSAFDFLHNHRPDWFEQLDFQKIFSFMNPDQIKSYFGNHYSSKMKRKGLENIPQTEEYIKYAIKNSLSKFDHLMLQDMIDCQFPLNQPQYHRFIYNEIATHAFSGMDYPIIDWYSHTQPYYLSILKEMSPVFNIDPDILRDKILSFQKENFMKKQSIEFFPIISAYIENNQLQKMVEDKHILGINKNKML